MFKILHIMPRLKFANLSFNNLSSDIYSTINACDENEDTRETYPCLKSIVLNSTNITWRSFRHILKRIPMWVHINISRVKSCCVDYNYSIDENRFCQGWRNTLEYEQLRRHRLGWRRNLSIYPNALCKKTTLYRYFIIFIVRLFS